MQSDYLDQLAELALGSRLKRLTEKMVTDAGKVYRHFGIDVQPKWFTLLALLAEQEQVSVVEAAERLGLSQPAVSQFCKQMQAQGLIAVSACGDDSRKRLMSLSDLGRQRFTDMQPMCEAVEKAAIELCTAYENDFYASLAKFEKALAERSLVQRTLEHFHATHSSSD